MKKIVTLFYVIFLATLINAQVLVEENFDYSVGDSVTTHGWLAHSGAGLVPIKVIDGNLGLAGYPLSNIGNMVQVTGGSGSREDVNLTFTPQTSGSVYFSFLIQVDTATLTGDYFFNMGPSPIATSFRGRIFVRDDSTNTGHFRFGLAQSSSNPVYSSQTFQYGTTNLIVLEYQFVPAALNDDTVRVFINPDLSMNQPVPNMLFVYTSVNADLLNVGAAALRQGAQAYAMKVDGLKVTTQWNDIIPVELTSFNAIASGNSVNINWSTATETNNQGFELYRNNQKVSFIQGKGTTTERQSYSFNDKNLVSGKYNYQLFQIDFDGTKSLVAKSSVEVLTGLPTEFSLSQNYPNPFNPSTTINFALPTQTNVRLTVFNAIGKEVATLVNANMEAGNHSAVWNAGNNASGMYFFKLQAGNFTSTKKMLLIK